MDNHPPWIKKREQSFLCTAFQTTMRMSEAPAGVVLYGGDGDGVTVLVGEVLVAAAPLLLAHVGEGQEGRLVQRQVQQLPIVGALGEEEEVHDHLHHSAQDREEK
jgi:hypothetical protein